MTLRYYWKDPRIKPVEDHMNEEDSLGKFVNLHPSETKTIWMPDTYIDQAVNLRKPKYFLEPSSLRFIIYHFKLEQNNGECLESTMTAQ